MSRCHFHNFQLKKPVQTPLRSRSKKHHAVFLSWPHAKWIPLHHLQTEVTNTVNQTKLCQTDFKWAMIATRRKAWLMIIRSLLKLPLCQPAREALLTCIPFPRVPTVSKHFSALPPIFCVPKKKIKRCKAPRWRAFWRRWTTWGQVLQVLGTCCCVWLTG